MNARISMFLGTANDYRRSTEPTTRGFSMFTAGGHALLYEAINHIGLLLYNIIALQCFTFQIFVYVLRKLS
jgi:hypothetical protein